MDWGLKKNENSMRAIYLKYKLNKIKLELLSYIFSTHLIFQRKSLIYCLFPFSFSSTYSVSSIVWFSHFTQNFTFIITVIRSAGTYVSKDVWLVEMSAMLLCSDKRYHPCKFSYSEIYAKNMWSLYSYKPMLLLLLLSHFRRVRLCATP